jgi:hypothetical protein
MIDAMEVTKYVNCKLSFSPKKHKKGKNVEKKLKIALHLIHSTDYGHPGTAFF